VDVVHNRGKTNPIKKPNAAAEYPVDPNNVVIEQAEADATRPIPITNGGANKRTKSYRYC
jgi:hypothetical protein